MLILLIVLWMVPNIVLAQFANESEFALVKTGGNSDIQTTNARTSNIYKWKKNQILASGRYLYGETKSGVSARNWDLNGKFEREVHPHISFFLGEIVEGNNFTGIKARYNSDAGGKYYYIKNDLKNVFSELGYRYTVEDRIAPVLNTYDNKARFYNEINHKISQTVQYKFWLEYIPNFTERKDYLINGEASLTSILNSVFSLKVSYLGLYDNLPARSGLKNFDFTTTTSLVAKF
jgi:putative salt-induced outer membrane protein